ncbi:MAG: LPP20 family lipoprotein [Lentisphaeria bacterium]|nr:LPP20 family lipoprotein [Lentisphaeria bacterium]
MKLKFFCFITILFTAIFLSGAELQTAIARGIGSTSDAALKDALNQAVQQVVGSLVSSEAFVKNDELIKEQVLTYSDGFVQKYEVLKPAKSHSSGLVEITIKAFVAQKKLQKRLESVNILKVKVEGAQNIWAQLETEKFRKENAEALLIKTLSLLRPEDYLQVTLVDKNGNTGSKAQLNVIPTDDSSRVKISMGAIVTVNHRKFVKEVQPVLKDVLEKLCTSKTPAVTATDTNRPSKFGFIISDDGTLKERNHGELHIIAGETSNRRAPEMKTKENMFKIALNVSKRYNVEQQKFNYYDFPKTDQLRKYLRNYNQSYHLLTFILKDQDGEEIKRYSQKVFNYQDFPILLSCYGYDYIISPEIAHSRGGSTGAARAYSITFEMKQSDVKDIRSMELVLEGRK